jgi:hypothetical protein
MDGKALVISFKSEHLQLHSRFDIHLAPLVGTYFQDNVWGSVLPLNLPSLDGTLQHAERYKVVLA